MTYLALGHITNNEPGLSIYGLVKRYSENFELDSFGGYTLTEGEGDNRVVIQINAINNSNNSTNWQALLLIHANSQEITEERLEDIIEKFDTVQALEVKVA